MPGDRSAKPLETSPPLSRAHRIVRERVPTLVNDRPPAPDLEKVEERITSRLAAVTTVAEMQEAGRNLASLAANNARVMLSAQNVIDQALVNLCGLGALNVALVAIGVWDARRGGPAARQAAVP